MVLGPCSPFAPQAKEDLQGLWGLTHTVPRVPVTP